MNFLYAMIISPIEMIVDFVFTFIYIKLEFLGVIGAVVGVSLAINFLALPIYNIAEGLQEKERNLSKSMSRQVNRIRETFKGDERFMMLSTYYKLKMIAASVLKNQYLNQKIGKSLILRNC